MLQTAHIGILRREFHRVLILHDVAHRDFNFSHGRIAVGARTTLVCDRAEKIGYLGHGIVAQHVQGRATRQGELEPFGLMALVRFEHQNHVGFLDIVDHLDRCLAHANGLVEPAPIDRIGKDPQRFAVRQSGLGRRRPQLGHLDGLRLCRCWRLANFHLAIFIAQTQFGPQRQPSKRHVDHVGHIVVHR